MPFAILRNFFQPSLKVANFFQINTAEFFNQGYRGIILDLDNTILSRKEKLLNHNFVNWLGAAEKQGFKLAIVSNNFKKSRLHKVFEQTNLTIINPAFKPLPFGFLLAFKRIEVGAKKCLVIGDQVSTDILGGNLLGCYTILTEPLFLETNSFRKFVQNLDRLFSRLFQ
jgi:HAD superfamily phosphatase (TIGR01668 family)